MFLDLFKQVPGQHFFCVGVSFHGVVGPPFRQSGFRSGLNLSRPRYRWIGACVPVSLEAPGPGFFLEPFHVAPGSRAPGIATVEDAAVAVGPEMTLMGRRGDEGAVPGGMGLGQGSDPWREIGKLARKQRQFEAPSGFGCTPELLPAHLTCDFSGILKSVVVDGDARDERAVWRAGLRLHKRMHPKVVQAALGIEPADHGGIRILSGRHSDMNEQPGEKIPP